MALTVDSEFNEIKIPGAYVVVVSPQVSENKRFISFDVKKSVSAGGNPFSCGVETAPYDILGANLFEQAYEYLKTLPEFAGATDC